MRYAEAEVLTVDAAIKSYMQTNRVSAFTGLLAMSGWYSLFPSEPTCLDTEHKWPAKFPNAGKPGVYLIFNAAMSLLYVGMTTRDVNRRLGDYFGYVAGRGSDCLIKNMLPPWKMRPYYVRTILLAQSDEAPLLEAYLIEKLNPPENSRKPKTML